MNYISKPLMEMKEMVYKSSKVESEVLYVEEYGDASFDMGGRFYTTEEIVEEGRNAIKAIDIYMQNHKEV